MLEDLDEELGEELLTKRSSPILPCKAQREPTWVFYSVPFTML